MTRAFFVILFSPAHGCSGLKRPYEHAVELAAKLNHNALMTFLSCWATSTAFLLSRSVSRCVRPRTLLARFLPCHACIALLRGASTDDQITAIQEAALAAGGCVIFAAREHLKRYRISGASVFYLTSACPPWTSARLPDGCAPRPRGKASRSLQSPDGGQARLTRASVPRDLITT